MMASDSLAVAYLTTNASKTRDDVQGESIGSVTVIVTVYPSGQFELDVEPVESIRNPSDKFYKIVVSVSLLKPKSRGFVALKPSQSVNESEPKVDPRYLSDESDLNNLRELINQALSFMDSKPFREIKTTSVAPDIDNCGDQEPWTDAYIDCFIGSQCGSGYNYVGTAKIGHPYDKYG